MNIDELDNPWTCWVTAVTKVYDDTNNSFSKEVNDFNQHVS